MSYEGYYQILCSNGHLDSRDCYECYGDMSEWKCPDCGAECVWWNSVDVTNGSYCTECNPKGLPETEGCEWCRKGRIDNYVELEVASEATFETCDKCGLTKQFVKSLCYSREFRT